MKTICLTNINPKKLWVVWATASTLSFYGCQSNRELMYRYTAKTETTDDALLKTKIDVDVSVQDPPGESKTDPVLAYKLDPKAEKELIKQLGAKGEELIKLLGMPLSPPDDPKPFLKETYKFTRRVVILVANQGNIGADRIARLKITLTDPTKNIRFINCDKIATQYQTVTLGTYGFQNTKSGELDASATYGLTGVKTGASKVPDSNGDTVSKTTSLTGGAGVSVSGKIGYSNQLSATSTSIQRSVALAASFKDNTISFYQEGAPGLDLTGTIISDVTFEFTSPKVLSTTFYSFSNLYNPKGVISGAQDTKLIRNVLSVPQLTATDEYKLNLSYTGTYRQITQNDNYNPEGYQKVNFVTGTNTKSDECLLIKAKDILPKLWGIRDTRSGRIIGIKIIGTASSMSFDSYQKAMDLLVWLLNSKDFANGLTTGKYKICIDQTPLTPADLANLIIDTI